MTEIQDLIERAKRYMKSAEILLLEEDYESSVSRVYYALFFCTEAILLTKGLTYSTHKGVISGFGKEFVKNGVLPKTMGRELNRAFSKRQLSDYSHSFSQSMMERLFSTKS